MIDYPMVKWKLMESRIGTGYTFTEPKWISRLFSDPLKWRVWTRYQASTVKWKRFFNVPVHGRCGERMSPKVQPSTRPGIEAGTFWLAVRDLTNFANLAHTKLIWGIDTFYTDTYITFYTDTYIKPQRTRRTWLTTSPSTTEGLDMTLTGALRHA